MSSNIASNTPNAHTAYGTEYVSETSRIWALLAYLLLIVGWLLVMLLRRNDSFARYHAHQSLRMMIATILTPLLWAVASWLAIFVPLAGPMFAAASFALVIAVALAFVIAWILGMVNALRGQRKPLPLFG